MIRAWLLLLVGCDQAFGLNTTHPIDGHGIDAPFNCPPIGQTPKFAVGLHQLPALGGCRYLRVAGSRAVASCFPGGGVWEGPAEGPLAPIAALGISGGVTYDQAHLTPEADDMFVHSTVPIRGNQSNEVVSVYHRGSPTMWTHTYDPAIPMATQDQLGTLTAGATGRRLVMWVHATDSYAEFISDGGTGWTAGPVHSGAELHASGLGTPALTTDGLRMIFSGMPEGSMTRAILYTDRASLTATFRAADVLEGVPALLYDPFLADDCSRVYFSADEIDAMFYAQQR